MEIPLPPQQEPDLSSEQRRRMEENRVAALARLQARRPSSLTQTTLPFRQVKTLVQNLPSFSLPHKPDPPIVASVPSAPAPSPSSAWNLAPCTNLQPPPPSSSTRPPSAHLPPAVFSLELTTLREFAVHPKTPDTRAAELIRKVSDFMPPVRWVLADDLLHSQSMVPVYNCSDYNAVSRWLLGFSGIQIQLVPQNTLKIIKSILQAKSDIQDWNPFRSSHVHDTHVEELVQNIPCKLRDSMLPFQLDGVRYGLRRGGRCLIADEMGVGKTIQAIALASCYLHEGPLLVVCPASLRLMWAEELERWLPSLQPINIHLVFGRRNNLLETMETPKVVVISYTMLHRLRKSMLARHWAMLIVDESHNLRCTKRKVECDETTVVLDLAQRVKRLGLLSGTPSLSRPFDIFHQVNCIWPGLLGKSKYEFAENYCWEKSLVGFSGQTHRDYSKGTRLHELSLLLKETIMIRRLKENVLTQLPPKRRQVIRLKLSPSDVKHAKKLLLNERNDDMVNYCDSQASLGELSDFDETNDAISKNSDQNLDFTCEGADSAYYSSYSSLSCQEIGVAKLRGFQEWLLNHTVFNSEEESSAIENKHSEKMIIFGHHLKVLDLIQEVVQNKGIEYVRIDGSTMAKDRQDAVQIFKSKDEVKVAIIGLTAGGVGLNFSSAQSVVFLELPKTASELMQAEDRSHRIGQQNVVNIYIFCAKDTADETHWQSLSRSLERISMMTNGVDDSLPGIEVHSVCSSSQIAEKSREVQNCHINVNLSEDKKVEDSGDMKKNASCNTQELKMDMPKVPIEPNIVSSNDKVMEDDHQADSTLMFEVSSNTGRIHLYQRSTVDGLRPVPMSENFEPGELEAFAKKLCVKKTSLPECLTTNTQNFKAALQFVAQWSALRPVNRNMLFGRPLQIPLEFELNCIKSKFRYASGGLVRGGSTRRVTPMNEVSKQAPDGAMMKNVTLPRHYGNKVWQTCQEWSSDGVPLCKLCQNPCLSSKSKAPEFMEDLFCKISCYEHYRMKTSQQYLRQELFRLERGICSLCKLDCHGLVERIRRLPLGQREKYVIAKAPGFQTNKRKLEKLVNDPKEGNAWHADHIIPVFKGGGECGLENMRTLCVVCHGQVTEEQRKRRRSSLSRAKRGLQCTIEKLIAKVCQKRMKSMSGASKEGEVECSPNPKRAKSVQDGEDCLLNPKRAKSDRVESDSSESESEDDDILSVKVVGSVYSREQGETSEKSPQKVSSNSSEINKDNLVVLGNTNN